MERDARAHVKKARCVLRQKAADVWKKDVWEFQAFSQTFLELRFSLGNEGKDRKNLNSQTWPGTPRRPSPRHPRPPDCASGDWWDTSPNASSLSISFIAQASVNPTGKSHGRDEH